MRLIDADELIYGLKTEFGQFAMKYILAFIKAQPTIDPVKHGHWIKAGQPNENSETLYRCSICGYLEVAPLYDTNNYCGNCGARMDGKEE